MSRFGLRMLLSMSAVAFAACGDSTGVTVLSEEEASALADAIVQSAFLIGDGAAMSPAAVGGPAAAPYSYSGDVSFTAECPLGGAVDVDGSVDAEGDDVTGAGRIELLVNLEHLGCVVESEDGNVFTLNGSPGVSVGLVLETDGETQLDWSGAIEGGVDWATEARDGRCQIALDFSGSVVVQEGLQVAVEGSVCGVTVSHSVSIVVGTA